MYDVIVIGGGHAGCEAFAAAIRIGVQALLVTPSLAEIAHQPCNPAVGGPGKSQLVREVVALGGLMGLAADRSGLQFRTLNRRKGPAVRATRVQTDSRIYSEHMVRTLSGLRGDILEDRALGVEISRTGGRPVVCAVHLERGGRLEARCVVVTTGTFLRGRLFVGDRTEAGGRRGAGPSVRLARSLEEAGLPLLRLKTGTCPRIDAKTVDFSRLEPQPGEHPIPFFDPRSTTPQWEQLPCFLTYTTPQTQKIALRNLHRSALYSGAITGIGPRYCPSFETKVERFRDRDRHQLFLEPEDRSFSTVYPSGLSTSFPQDVQDELVASIPGLEKARIVRYGYAVEYDAVQPSALQRTLESCDIDRLYLAGQVIGTSGYEEAAGLGLVAGANAALASQGAPPLVLARQQAYLGVMIDDLTTRGVDEPYRMLTARAEYRLLLREDNAQERLLEVGSRTGLIDAEQALWVRTRRAVVLEACERLGRDRLNPSVQTNARLRELGLPEVAKPTILADFLRRAGVRLSDLRPVAPWLDGMPDEIASKVEVEIKYGGYLEREEAQARELSWLEKEQLPLDLDYRALPGLRCEIVEKLARLRPSTLGQASRIPGMTPAALQVLHVHVQAALDRNSQ
ncbi:MAG: tRNA uridine-5-carboxymethylaminomethyl(34) synthesis enzyme MnmG [Myxococcota bacterium]|jgi:tRNA uridine 5-carboxymethylaminomethyl modification enzyme|nr:tRNA uridine-5-carboxymethylaminomethyl(34) synthesis enzyme MnmG [Myxococcota bacterium]